MPEFSVKKIYSVQGIKKGVTTASDRHESTTHIDKYNVARFHILRPFLLLGLSKEFVYTLLATLSILQKSVFHKVPKSKRKKKE